MELARSLWQLAEHGDMPAEEQREAGVEAIMLARRSLEINTQLYGAASEPVANSMGILASVLDYFNDVNDDEVPRLHEQSKSIHARLHGSLIRNVASCEGNLGEMYRGRAKRANAVNDLDREVANLELALPRFRESARIFRAINHVDMADKAEGAAVKIEECLRDIAKFSQHKRPEETCK